MSASGSHPAEKGELVKYATTGASELKARVRTITRWSEHREEFSGAVQHGEKSPEDVKSDPHSENVDERGVRRVAGVTWRSREDVAVCRRGRTAKFQLISSGSSSARSRTCWCIPRAGDVLEVRESHSI